jgi:hypothetical protein
MLFGAPLKTAVFNGSQTSNWIWGGDFKAGYSMQGRTPPALELQEHSAAKGSQLLIKDSRFPSASCLEEAD